MKHILSGKYFNNWGFSGDSTQYCRPTEIENLTKFELKHSILNRDVPQVLLHDLTK